MKVTNLIALALVVGGPMFVTAQAPPRQDGRWEVTVEMEMPGMPMKMPAQTLTRCVTPEEAKDPQKALPQGGPNGENACKVSDYKMVGNTVTWTMACAPPREMTGTGEMVYEANAYKGTIKMNMGGQTMVMKHSGKRLGDCTK